MLSISSQIIPAHDIDGNVSGEWMIVFGTKTTKSTEWQCSQSFQGAGEDAAKILLISKTLRGPFLMQEG